MTVTDALPVYHHRERHRFASPPRRSGARRGAGDRLEDVPLVSMLFRLRGLRAAPRGPIWASLQDAGLPAPRPRDARPDRRPGPRGGAPGRRGLRPLRRAGVREDGAGSARARRTATVHGSRPRRASSSPTRPSRRRFGAYWLVIRPFSGLTGGSGCGPRSGAPSADRILFCFSNVTSDMATSRADTARAAVDLTFEELYRGLRADVYRAALRKLGNPQDAEDVTQAAFADAVSRRAARGAAGVAARVAARDLGERRRRRFRTAQRRPREELVDDADFPLAAELPYEQSRALTEALATLPRSSVGSSCCARSSASPTTRSPRSSSRLSARCRCCSSARGGRCATCSIHRSSRVRRPLFLPPLPGWLVGLWSRAELADTDSPCRRSARRGRAHRRRRERRRSGLAGGRAPARARDRPERRTRRASRRPRRYHQERGPQVDAAATSRRPPAARAESPRPPPATRSFRHLGADGRPCRRSRRWVRLRLWLPNRSGRSDAGGARSRRDSRGGVAEQPVALPVPPVLVPVPLPEPPPLPFRRTPRRSRQLHPHCPRSSRR